MTLAPWARIAVAIALVCTSGFGAAQTIYRCGNSYSRVPCPNGQVLDIGDPRSAAQRAEALRVAAAEKRLGDTMAQERRQAEAHTKPAGPASLSPSRPASAPVAKTAHAPTKGKKRHPTTDAEARGDFVAAVPGSGHKASSRP